MLMQPSYNKKPPPKQPINDQIRYHQLRVVDDDGQAMIMSKGDALRLADQQGMDLVVINDTATPPIAKIILADKYFYEQKRREKELAKKQRESRIDLKEVQFRPGISVHDFETKLKHIEKFLTNGDKVKCMVQYRGRENANKQVGFEIMDRVAAQSVNAEWDSKPTINGNKLIGILKRGKNV
jgi:translation initiation factor IF-3